jgi:hypothetical protein
MSNSYRGHQTKGRRHLLVFDTSALLSANEKDRVQVWRNNEQLGDCFIPGATFEEIQALEKDTRRPKEQAKAKAFLKFYRDGCRYEVQPLESKNYSPSMSLLPINNQNDRQILACAIRLADQYQNCVIILVTYEMSLQGLVKQFARQKGTPNLCALPADRLATWFHHNYKEDTLPFEVREVYKRMNQGKNQQKNHRLPDARQKAHARSLPASHSSSKPQPAALPYYPAGKVNPRFLPAPKHSTHNGQNQILKLIKSPGFIAGAVILLALGVFVTAKPNQPSFEGQIPGIVTEAAIANPQPFQPTPPDLIARAETAIIEFQQADNKAALTQTLNSLQELKNQQGGQLDDAGEQRLGRLKHKYAIEVLATSGQLSEAATLLRQISPNYSDIEYVRQWLVEQNR